jgi:hypothetical protein
LRTTILLAALIILGSGCVDPPRIGRGLSNDVQQARTAFDQRVKEQFPVGSPEKALREELRRQRFVLVPSTDRPSEHSAIYEDGQLVCRVTWVVLWSADVDRITHVAGDRRDVCL